MKWLAVFLIFPSVAFAHPVDAPCPAGETTEDGCQPVIHALKLDNPDFFAAHKAYWHCRRLLVVESITPLAECVGANQELSALLKETYAQNVSETALLTYWGIVPAHPELDRLDQEDVGASILRAQDQEAACELTRVITSVVSGVCEYNRAQLLKRVVKKFRIR